MTTTKTTIIAIIRTIIIMITKKLDDGWPEGEEEHVTLVLLQRECKEHKKI